MALFPGNPTNGQTTVVNGITYTYNTAQTAWIRTSVAPTDIIDLTVTGTLTVTGNANVGNVNATQIISSATTGTAPLVVNSTTKVANLNVESVDGYDTSTANTPNTIAVRNSDGNISANYFIGNGSQLTGIITSVSSISNGTSNLSIPAVNGNVTVSAAGNANILTVTGTGANVNGTLSVTGNANVGNIGATNGVFTNVSGNGANLSSITGANVTGTVANATYAVTAGTVTTNAQPNITSVGTLTGLVTSGDLTPSTTNTHSLGNSTHRWNNLWISGNTINLGDATITTEGNNVIIVNPAGGEFVVTGNGVGSSNNIYNGNSSVSIPNSNGNVIVNINDATNVAVITSTGVNVAGTLTATGNISGNYIIGNGAFLTGIDATAIQNGTANVRAFNNGNVAISASGNANIVVVTGIGANVAGDLAVTGNVSGNIFTGNGSGLSALAGANVTGQVGYAVVANSVAGANVSGAVAYATTANAVAGANVSGEVAYAAVANSVAGANVSGQVANALVAGTVYTAEQPNITSVGTLSSLSVTGNIQSSANVIVDSIVGKTTGVSITAAGSNTNITLAPNGTGTVDVSSKRITNLAEPISATDAASKQYVDEVAEGLQAKPAVELGTLTNLSATYNNGNAGVGATLTSTTTGAFPTIDGVTLTSTTFGENGVLVKNQSNAAQNGRYNLTTVGDGSNPWVLTRCGLCDEADEIPGSYIFIKNGATQAGTGWVAVVSEPFTVGTTAINYFQFSGSGTYTAGTGLTLTGTQFSISNTTVTAASYGNGDRVATFTVNSQGQLTAASDTVITANAANLTGTTLAATIVNSSLTSVGTLGTLSVTGNANVGNIGATNGVFANVTGNGSALSSITGSNVTGEVAFAAVANLVAGANVSGPVAYATTANAVAGANVSGQVANALVAGTVYTNAQPNITSVGTLTALNVSGNVSLTGPNVSLGSVANLKIAGGTSGYFLKTDGAGNLSWDAAGSTGNTAYVYTQASPATTWTINHNLGVQYVNIQVIDSTGNSFTGRYNYPTITFNNATHCTVTFDSAQAGYAAVTSGGGSAGPEGPPGASGGGIISNGSSNVNIATSGGNVTVGVGGVANVMVATSTGVNVSGTFNATGNANVGNLVVPGTFNATGNANVGNLVVSGTITATGNITGDYILGNGSQLTGIITSVSNVTNGTSNLNIATANGNVTVSVAGNANILTVSGTGANVTGTLNVSGAFAATSKSFLIDHPTKEGMKLRYGSLEGPENGVYVRGRLSGNNTIELPDYWLGLVDENTFTVNLTPVGDVQNLYVKDITKNYIVVGSSDDHSNIDCFYVVFAERKDVEKLIVEF